MHQSIVITYLDDAQSRGFELVHLHLLPPPPGHGLTSHGHPTDESSFHPGCWLVEKACENETLAPPVEIVFFVFGERAGMIARAELWLSCTPSVRWIFGTEHRASPTAEANLAWNCNRFKEVVAEAQELGVVRGVVSLDASAGANGNNMQLPYLWKDHAPSCGGNIGGESTEKGQKGQQRA